MEQNKNINELMEAYQEDQKRKSQKEDELKDAKEYLSVLLQEAEDKNAELESREKETRELREKLNNKIEEVKELTTGSVAKNRRRSFVAWVCVAIFELVCIIGLIVYMIFLKPEEPAAPSTPSESIITEGDGEIKIIDNVMYVRHETTKYNDNLEQAILATDFTDMEFSGKVEKKDDLEYLTFSNGKISVSYRNEYFNNDTAFRKSVIVEKDDKRYIFAGNYDLTRPVAELAPIITTINDEEYLVFTDDNKTTGTGIMSSLRLFNISNFRYYENKTVEKTLMSLFDCEYINASDLAQRDADDLLNEAEPADTDRFVPLVFGSDEEDFVVFTLDTPKSQYRYRFTSAEYDDLTYYENDMPVIADDFTYTIDEKGIHWTTFVRLGDDYVLGEYFGDLIPSDNGIGVSGAKFGAFIQKEFGDPLNYELITPATEVPERYYPLGWGGTKRILVAIDESLTMSDIDFNRVDTSDTDGWLYLDADGQPASIKGIDVSKYQGRIDWAKVAQSGVKFALIRLGYRGMNEGTLELDNYYESNIKAANANGIECGIYFFSEAINEKEAIAEADFVLNHIKGKNVTYPIAFDTERVTTYDARANGLSMQERTDVCIAFCERIKEAGYTPLIYANSTYFLTGLDLSRLEDYDKWYALYSNTVSFPYKFDIFQYTDSGHVDGISGTVDINMAFKDYAAKKEEE